MPSVGDKIKVRYTDGFTYTLDVQVTAICEGNQFTARVERVFSGGGEITGGDILARIGQEMTFANDDIVLR